MDENKGNIIIYQSEDGVVRLDVRLEDKTVWLTIDQMAELFGKSRSTINEHILHIYEEGELEEEKTKRKIGISDFSTKPTSIGEELLTDGRTFCHLKAQYQYAHC